MGRDAARMSTSAFDSIHWSIPFTDRKGYLVDCCATVGADTHCPGAANARAGDQVVRDQA